MKEILLVKVGELALKGLNRRTFEDILIKNIKRRIASLGQFEIKNAQSTIYIEPKSTDVDLDETAERLGTVFGIAAYSRACVAQKDMEDIKARALEYLADELDMVKTFKVEAKRSDKRFALQSPQICAQLGEAILQRFPHVCVDVHHPDLTVTVEIRDFGAYIRGGALKGAGGIPVGTGGRAAILISGGIDSPVAAYMMAKRGIMLTAVHFASPPYTSERAEQKVRQLLELVARYSGRMTLYTVPFTQIQEEIRKGCPEELFTIIMRRFMMQIAQKIAQENECQALITGESLGQVASQTIHAIACTDEVCTMPVFRPLIGMDKDEIITIARKIGTFETSIQPYEYCCTVFTPKHPRTRPVLKYVRRSQEALDCATLMQNALEHIKTTKIDYEQ